MKTTHITIYGPECTRCTTLVSNTEEAVRTLPGRFEIEKISNPLEIAEAGIFNTSAIAVNGTITELII
ncbi:MAG: thioredoxin family protein [Akkermansia sp.]|nr:thioredoxin family protein [Akkermansia sp.]